MVLIEFDDLEPLRSEPTKRVRDYILSVPTMDDASTICGYIDSYMVWDHALRHSNGAAINGLFQFHPVAARVALDRARDERDGLGSDARVGREFDLELLAIDQAEQAPAINGSWFTPATHVFHSDVFHCPVHCALS